MKCVSEKCKQSRSKYYSSAFYMTTCTYFEENAVTINDFLVCFE